MEPAKMTVTAAVTQIFSILGNAASFITENEVLMLVFCGGLVTMAFKIFKRAKRAAK